MRVLYVNKITSKVENIIEYEDLPSADREPSGYIYMQDPTGNTNVQDTVDYTNTLKERSISATELFVFKELFRLTNEVRALRGNTAITANQYRNAVKSQIS